MKIPEKLEPVESMNPPNLLYKINEIIEYLEYNESNLHRIVDVIIELNNTIERILSLKFPEDV